MKTHPHTWLFDTPDIMSGLAAEGYRTVCIGGVIFSPKKSTRTCVAKLFPAKLLADDLRCDQSAFHRASGEPCLEAAKGYS